MDRRHFLLAGLTGVAGCSDMFSRKPTKTGDAPTNPAPTGGGGPPPPKGASTLNISQARLLPDDKRLLTSSHDRITLWHIHNTYEYPVDSHDLGTTDFMTYTGNFDVSKDGKRLLTGGRDHLHLWDIDTGKEITRIATDACYVAFGSDENHAISLPSNGKNITIWDLSTKQPIQVFAGPGTDERSVGFSLSRDGARVLMTFGEHRSATEFFLEPAADQSAETYVIAAGVTGKRMKRGVTIDGEMNDFVASYFDGATKALSRTQKSCQIWDLATAKCIKTFPSWWDARRVLLGPNRTEDLLFFLEAAFSNMGTVVTYTILVFHWKSGREMEKIPGPGFYPTTLACTSDDRFVVIGGDLMLRNGKNVREAEVIDEKGTLDLRCLSVWDRKEKKYRRIADFGRESS